MCAREASGTLKGSVSIVVLREEQGKAGALHVAHTSMCTSGPYMTWTGLFYLFDLHGASILSQSCYFPLCTHTSVSNGGRFM